MFNEIRKKAQVEAKLSHKYFEKHTSEPACMGAEKKCVIHTGKKYQIRKVLNSHARSIYAIRVG